jgi:hypothetical protein
MDSVVTTILTDETVRTPEAVESLIAESLNDSMQPWLSEEA